MRTPMKVSRRAGLLLAALTLAACVQDETPIAGIPRGAADGLYPQIVVNGSRGESPELQVSLLRKPRGVLLGSFQAELRYDAAALSLKEMVLAGDAYGTVNEVAPGRVRFVGTSLDGLGEMPLVTLRFSRTGEVKAESFTLTFEEVSAAADLSDITGTVYAGPPLVTLR